MPAKPSSTLAERVSRRYRSLVSTSHRIERLVSGRQVARADALLMYEGLFLSAQVLTDAFIEDLFVGLLVKDRGVVSARRDVQPRVDIRSHKVARSLLIGPKGNYVDWSPYDRTEKLAEIYFRGGRPFCDLDRKYKDVYRNCSIIRNAIAHKSAFSLEKFHANIIKSATLPPAERTPAGYLRGIFRASPSQTRFYDLMGQLSICARQLTKG